MLNISCVTVENSGVRRGPDPQNKNLKQKTLKNEKKEENITKSIKLTIITRMHNGSKLISFEG